MHAHTCTHLHTCTHMHACTCMFTSLPCFSSTLVSRALGTLGSPRALAVRGSVSTCVCTVTALGYREHAVLTLHLKMSPGSHRSLLLSSHRPESIAMSSPQAEGGAIPSRVWKEGVGPAPARGRSPELCPGNAEKPGRGAGRPPTCSQGQGSPPALGQGERGDDHLEPPWRCDCCQRGLPKPRRGREIPWLLPPLQPRAPQRSPWLSPSGSQLTGARNSQQGPLGLTAERGRAGRDLRTNGAGMGPGGTRIAHKSANGRHCGSQLPLTPQEEGAQAGAWESRRAHELGLLTAAGRKHPRSALDPRACPARPLRCCEPLIPAGKCPPALSNTIATPHPRPPWAGCGMFTPRSSFSRARERVSGPST